MSPIVKWGGGFIAVLVVLAIIGAAVGDTDDGGTDAATLEDSFTAANIVLVPSKSACIQNPLDAKIYFAFTLRNDGQELGEIDARPWRRYSDNDINDSIVDTLTMEVPPGEKRFRAEFGYNAEDHSLLECGLIMEGETEPTMIEAG